MHMFEYITLVIESFSISSEIIFFLKKKNYVIFEEKEKKCCFTSMIFHFLSLKMGRGFGVESASQIS